MTAELTQFSDLIAIYAIVVTLFAAYVVYALWDAKRTLKLIGLAAKAKVATQKFEASVQKTIAEAEEIISKAKGKPRTAPKTRAATQKRAAARK